jgi:hypothetical protein
MTHRYGQLSTDLFFKADEHGLGREFAFVVAWMAQAGQETLPFKEFQKAVKKLAEIGIVLKLDDVLGAALANRVRQQRHRNKIKDIASTRNVTPDVTPDVTGNATSNVSSHSLSLSSSPTEKKGGRAPRAPKQPSKGRRALDAFNAAVTEVTGSPSTTMGISMERKAAAMQDAIDAAGETWTQAVKRRHDLGKSLNLHWMANDYASDRTMRQRPTLVRPNLSNNLLQHDNHPEGAGEEYWLQGIEKYKYGGTNG